MHTITIIEQNWKRHIEEESAREKEEKKTTHIRLNRNSRPKCCVLSLRSTLQHTHIRATERWSEHSTVYVRIKRKAASTFNSFIGFYWLTIINPKCFFTVCCCCFVFFFLWCIQCVLLMIEFKAWQIVKRFRRILEPICFSGKIERK